MVNCIKLKIQEYFELIKFEHTIFALPFALSGMLLALPAAFPPLKTIILVILAMVSGRTGAMALNRLIDADIDKKNPRTSQRAIPAGRIKKLSALILACLSFTVLALATFHLPAICLKFLPLAIFVLVLYPYTKRFTSLSHLVLGCALGISASGGWIAASAEISLPVVLWGLSVIFWVAGFDIIYAIQDIDFDRENNLFSIPAWLGISNSLLISKTFHVVTVLTLATLGFIYPVNNFYWAGIIFVLGMLFYEHSLLKEDDFSKVNIAFFNINGYVSIGLFLFILAGKFFYR